jgi:hypothetical protein
MVGPWARVAVPFDVASSSGVDRYPPPATTGIAFFAECLRHSAKAILHTRQRTLGKDFIGKGFFAECFFRTLGKDFAECQKALGKEKHSAN